MFSVLEVTIDSEVYSVQPAARPDLFAIHPY